MTDSEGSYDEVDQLISEDEYEVEAIMGHRKRGPLTEYLVKWKDYDDDSNTWEPAANLADAQALVDRYFDSLETTKKTRKRTKSPKANAKRATSVDSTHSQSSDIDIQTYTETDGKRDTTSDSMDQSSTSTAKKIRIIPPKNGSSSASKKLKTVDLTDDADDTDFVDAASGFGSDTDVGNQEVKQVVLKCAFDDGLERIVYKLENEDGDSEKITVIVDEKYPSGDIDWDEKVERIVVVIGKNDSERQNDSAIVKWSNGKYSLHRMSDLRYACPQRLIDYYQRYVLF